MVCASCSARCKAFQAAPRAVARGGLHTPRASVRARASEPQDEYAFADDYNDDEYLEPLDASDETFADEPQLAAAPLMAAEVAIMQGYGLKLDALLRPATRLGVADADTWDSGFEAQDDLAFGAEPEPMSEEEKAQQARIDHHFAARKRWETEQAEDLAFTLHHAQMERSFNPYTTTIRFAQVLEDLSHTDEVDPSATGIPIWIRANFVFEQDFDAWNDNERGLASEQMDPTDAVEAEVLRMADNAFRGQSETNQSRIPDVKRQAAPKATGEEEAADEEDSLDSLLDVFPENAKKLEADLFAADLLSASDSPEDDQLPQGPKENVIDF